jgi:predicted RND superfamily exporter protein
MLLQVAAALLTFVLLKPFFGGDVAVWPALLVFILGTFWGLRSLGVALMTTGPILVVVIWLYGLISGLGYGLNMVTVAIATLSLGVGIDYVIHVVERFREERHHGRAVYPSLVAVGGASGLALVGSAASDVLGFLVISLSPMGFFSLFGMFSAAMIFFSLIASLILATALIGLLNKDELQADLQAAGGTWQQMQHLAEEEVSQAVVANGYSGESSAVDDGEE